MPEEKKYSASGFNEFLKTYKKKPQQPEVTQEPKNGQTIGGFLGGVTTLLAPKLEPVKEIADFITQASGLFDITAGHITPQQIDFSRNIIQPIAKDISDNIKGGINKLSDNPIEGSLQIGNSIGTLVASPFSVADQTLRRYGADSWATFGAKPFELIAEGYREAVKGIDSVVDRKKILRNIITGINPNLGLSLTDSQLQGIVEQGDLTAEMVLQFTLPMGVKKAGGLWKKGDVLTKEIVQTLPKDIPQDVKQTLQLEQPKTFDRVVVDPVGRTTTMPRTENTQAYTKLELLRDEVSSKKDNLVKERDSLKKRAFDKKITSQERIDAKNRLKEVNKELEEVSKQLPLINKELETKRFEIESKEIPEQKLLTEGTKETIPTENVPSNINYTLPKEKVVEIGKENQPTKGLPIEKPIVGDVAELQKPTEIIERRTDKAGKEYYYNTETKKRTSKTEYEKQVKPEEVKTEKPVDEYTPQDIVFGQAPTTEIVKEAQNINPNFTKDFENYKSKPENQKRLNESTDKIRTEGALIEEFAQQTVAKEKGLDVDINKTVEEAVKKTEPEKFSVETKVDKPIESIKPQESTIERLKREALDEFKKNQTTNVGFNPLAYKNQIKYGTALLKEGAVKFADWSQRMIKDLGEKIKPQLLRIWNEIKKFGEDLGKIAVDKIGEFIESKYNPARPNKIVDQSLFDRVKQPETKTAFSEGMRDIAQKDKETIKAEYRETIKQKEKLSTKVQNLLKETTDIKKVAKTVFEPITTSAEKVSKDVFRRFRLFGQSYQVNLLRRHEAIGKYFDIKKKSKISPDELADYNISLLNGWFDDAKVIARKYGFEKELNEVLKIKDDLAKELGVKTIENHFPRMVEDFDGFVKFLEEKFPDYYKDNFSRMILEKANKVGRELTVEEKANLINNALRGYNPGITLSDIGNMKKRVIQTLDGELARFYHTPDASLLKYVNEMTELAEARKFFGKGGYDVNESIGAYIQELRDGKKLSIEGSRELMEIFKARFNQKAITNRGITALRDVGVIVKLGNPYSTMTQLKDLAYSMYFSPTRTPVELAKLIGSKITGKTPEWQIKELGIDPLKIAEELANPKKRAKIVQNFLDYSGFSKLDMIGKETLINTLWQKYQKQSRELKLNTEFERRIERYFGKGEEKAKVLSDLRNGRKTDSTAFLLYNELVGAQPISLIEMPRGYLKGGNWRIAYFLKTFSIRQLDFALNETVRVMRDTSLPKEQRRQGFYNMVKLGTSLALVGASVDQIRSYLMNALVGKKNDQTFSQDMLDNLLNVSLLSRYDYTKTRQNGISEAIGSKLLPPMDFISDPLFYDLPNILEEKGKALKSTKHIPMLGRFIYEHIKGNNTSRRTRNTRR